MIGKAFEIKTMRVSEDNIPFQTTLNNALQGLGNVEVIQIQTHVYQNGDFPNYTYMDALIIYKEATQ